MSGGVDSSVAAAICAKAGYDVVGITLQLYNASATSKRRGACCAGQDIQDAKRVADQIGIKHYVLDYEQIFKSEVIDEFAKSYQDGLTPLPCVRCNEKIKYNDVPEWDSIGHMTLMSELEEGFDISIDTDDIIDFSSFKKGIQILKKYKVDQSN